MPGLTAWMLATTLLLTPAFATEVSRRIDVDCEAPRALERALAKAKKQRQVDIHLHGVCRGNFVIATDGVTLRGATRDSGLAAPEGDPGHLPVLEIVDAQTSLRGLVLRDGAVGVLVHGWNADVLLFEVDVHGQDGLGVYASRGARVRLIDSTVRDGNTGIAAQSDAEINLQRVVVAHQHVGVIVSAGSFAALTDSTIENSRSAGLGVGDRSDVNVLGGVFRENGQVHVGAVDRSSVTLLSNVTIGSETDTTSFALGVNRDATIASFTTPVIYGDASALVGGSIRLGSTVLNGDLTVVQFAKAHVRNSRITGIVACADGADAICRQTTTGGGFGCPSPTCGPATAEAADRAPSLFEPPEIELPRFERPKRSRPRP